jgi:hypothetical protein
LILGSGLAQVKMEGVAKVLALTALDVCNLPK